MQRIPKRFLLYLFLFTFTILSSCTRTNASIIAKEAQEHGTEKKSVLLEACELVKVTDGDTIWIKPKGTENSERFKVRLIGINTPESVHSDKTKNTKEGKEASKFLKALLEKYNTLYLEYDEAQYDKYGRTLAYVWLNNSFTDSYDDFKAYNLGAILIANGHAKPMRVKPNTKYAELYNRVENEAQNGQ